MDAGWIGVSLVSRGVDEKEHTDESEICDLEEPWRNFGAKNYPTIIFVVASKCGVHQYERAQSREKRITYRRNNPLLQVLYDSLHIQRN